MTMDPNDNDAGVFDPYEDEEEQAPVMDEFGNLLDPDEIPVAEEDADDEDADVDMPFPLDEAEVDADDATGDASVDPVETPGE